MDILPVIPKAEESRSLSKDKFRWSLSDKFGEASLYETYKKCSFVEWIVYKSRKKVTLTAFSKYMQMVPPHTLFYFRNFNSVYIYWHNKKIPFPQDKYEPKDFATLKIRDLTYYYWGFSILLMPHFFVYLL